MTHETCLNCGVTFGPNSHGKSTALELELMSTCAGLEHELKCARETTAECLEVIAEAFKRQESAWLREKGAFEMEIQRLKFDLKTLQSEPDRSQESDYREGGI